MSPQIALEDCWAKTDPVTGLPALTVRDHCLNVGAVALRLLPLLPKPARVLIPDGAPILVAAHDIGKITPGFLWKCSHWQCSEPRPQTPGETDHAKVSQWFLSQLPQLQDSRGRPVDWLLAAGGHHGRYPSYRAGPLEVREFSLSGWPLRLRTQLLEELALLLGPLPQEPIFLTHSDTIAAARVHLFTGFTTFCDWIGSDENSFPLAKAAPLAHAGTLPASLEAAGSALSATGLHKRSVVPGMPFTQLFSGQTGPTLNPRPIQSALIDAMDSPGLYIVEAPMGTGKTEAALAAAYRRWTTPDAERGLYFALPTQLTSQRIHQRIGSFLENIIGDSSTLALVHGNSWLNDNRILRLSPSTTEGRDEPVDQGPATAHHWFASTTRRALLAPFGTGTIDQALLSVLPAKHSALRFFALSGKVIVIDEVHSYDPYTSALVDRLISWTLRAGCTIIVLSATLTAQRRAALVAAAGVVETDAPTDYPLITKVAAGSDAAQHIRVMDLTPRQLEVTLSHSSTSDPEWMTQATESAEAGACVLVIRNTVALAQDTFRQLSSRRRGDRYDIGLLHSRFPQWQRDQQEEKWTSLLGKDNSQRPAGCVLVATQVVEQSVDIDADLLITDLAPTDLLLQRIGRLHRHNRPRPVGFTEAHCVILNPPVDWTGDARTIRSELAPHGYVYPPYALFRAQSLWHPRNSISLPEEIRPILEATYAPNDALPSGLHELHRELNEKTLAMTRTASSRAVFNSAAGDDREGAETRWIEQDTALVVLVSGLHVLHGNQVSVQMQDGAMITADTTRFQLPFAKELQRHAVRVPRYLVAAALRDQPEWLKIHINDAVVAVRAGDRTECEVASARPGTHQLHYHPDFGVFHTKAAHPSHSGADAEPGYDGWF
jgi:CRISPR-associated endonuclease/helicase Cas3